MPNFRERLHETETLLLQTQARPEGDRAQQLAVVADLLSDLIADLDTAQRAMADTPPQQQNRH